MRKINALRSRYLECLYRLSGGNQLKVIAYTTIREKLGWDDETNDGVSAYLKNEGLIRFPASGKVRLTHKGIKQVEKALPHPRREARRSAKAGAVTLMAEGDISIGGDVVGRDKTTSRSK